MASNNTSPPHTTTATATTSHHHHHHHHHRRRPAPLSVPTITTTSNTTVTPSETEPLIPRDSPPPRYSAIEPSWDVPLDNSGHNDNPARTHHAPTRTVQQSSVACPGWWTWVPGPAQMFPPGLEHLANVQSLTIRKKGRRYRVFRGGEMIYTVRMMKDATGLVLYRVQNNANLDVLLLNCTTEEALCSASFLHVEVSFPPGNVMGVVQGNAAEYTAHNPSGDLLFLFHRDSKTCCRKPGYKVETQDMQPFGELERVRSPRCCCWGRRIMEVNFPGDLDLRWKALLLGGAVVIRHMSW